MTTRIIEVKRSRKNENVPLEPDEVRADEKIFEWYQNRGLPR